MKTLQITISMVLFLLLVGSITDSHALNFESIKQKYIPLVNAVELNSVITNSSEFKEKTQGYHYNFATAISKVRYLQNNSYVLGPVDVVYSLYVSNFLNYDKTLVVTIDPTKKILGMMEYVPWNVPLGYPRPVISHLYTPENYVPPKMDISKLVNVMPPSPLEQVKHRVAVNDVDCFQGMQHLELIFKSEDKSPACVYDNTARFLTERGWAIRQNNQESLNLVDDHGGEISIDKNGTTVAKEMIDLHIQNFRVLSPPIVVKIFYQNGTLYKTDEISSNSIQADGYYKYNLTISSPHESDVFGQYRVNVEHNGNISEMLVGIPVPP
jgi:hypothetical protein